MTANPENLSTINVKRLDPRIEEPNRILVGGNGRPANPVAAATLYRAAVGRGSGAAAERLAVLAASGLVRPANWQEAIGWLVKAAELGHTPAHGQILALAGLEEVETGSGWLETARRIDMKSMLKAPQLTRVREQPAIALIQGLATPSMCRWLIRRGEEEVQPAMVWNQASGRAVQDPIRTGLAAGYGILDTDIVLMMTQKRLELASGLKCRQQEAPFVLRYEPGQQYKAHYDFLAPGEPGVARMLEVMGQRVATCLTWLNDAYEGGETSFPRIDWKHRGRPGDSLLFLNVRTSDREPDPLTLHAGLPVVSGRKWLLSQWVRDRAQPVA